MSTVTDAGRSEGGDSRVLSIIASAIAFWIVAAVFVALRFYVRTKIVRALGVEDWTILIALVFSLGNSVGQGLITVWGYGRHIWTISHDDFVNQAKAGFALQVCYTLSLALTKISILVLYLRILTYHNARWITWTVLVITILYNLAGFLVQVTTCIPLQKLWDSTVYGTCHSPSLSWFLVAFTIATDFIAFAMPIPIILKITMPVREKALLVSLFAVGFLECLISIIRVVNITQVVQSLDFTWDFVPISHWNCAELNVAIVCACLMTMKPLITRIWPGFLPGSAGVARQGDTSLPSNPSTIRPESGGFGSVGPELYVIDMEPGSEKGTGS